MQRDFEYENNNIGYDYQSPEGGIKCKNHILCKEILPEWWFECKGSYLCTNCDMMFGIFGGGKNSENKQECIGVLKRTGNLECPICLENKECISQPRCNHSVCISCFKRCYYGEESVNEPVFPYPPDIEDEYHNDPENIKWTNEYVLINKYLEEWNKWHDENDEKKRK